VLVAEDDAINRRVITDFLKEKGQAVKNVKNGALAIQALEEECFDLVLMDMQMPVMDGLEATRRIRAESRNRQAHIVALTAYAMPEDRERFLKCGMDDYITRPIDFFEVERVLRNAARTCGGELLS